MAAIPLDFQKETDFIEVYVQEHYREMPPGLAWFLVPLLGAIVAAVAFGNLDALIATLLSLAGAAVGLLIARSVVLRAPAWNNTRREKRMASARANFRGRFDAFVKKFERLVTAVEQLQKAIDAKSYRLYLQLMEAVGQCRDATKTDLDLLFVSMPYALSQLSESVEGLIREVESDPMTVTAYEPDLLVMVEFIRQRAAKKNVIDCYRGCKEIEPIFRELSQRHTPFDLATDVMRLRSQVQEYRDELLSDPHCETVWRDLQVMDARLAEEHRHNEVVEEQKEVRNDELRRQSDAMEKAAEAAEGLTEATRQQAAVDKERNEILREQRRAETRPEKG